MFNVSINICHKYQKIVTKCLFLQVYGLHNCFEIVVNVKRTNFGIARSYVIYGNSYFFSTMIRSFNWYIPIFIFEHVLVVVI